MSAADVLVMAAGLARLAFLIGDDAASLILKLGERIRSWRATPDAIDRRAKAPRGTSSRQSQGAVSSAPCAMQPDGHPRLDVTGEVPEYRASATVQPSKALAVVHEHELRGSLPSDRLDTSGDRPERTFPSWVRSVPT
jgi:hypothetical protein